MRARGLRPSVLPLRCVRASLRPPPMHTPRPLTRVTVRWHAARGLHRYCQPIGAGPQPATAGDTSDFCVGLFLLAAREVYLLSDALSLAS